MNTHKYFCEKCNYGTNIKYSLIQHNESELHKTGQRKKREKWTKEKKIYKCENCEYITSLKKNYMTHKLNNHSSKEERASSFNYYCLFCDIGVNTLLAFNQHKETLKHCNICNIVNKYENKDNIIII